MKRTFSLLLLVFYCTVGFALPLQNEFADIIPDSVTAAEFYRKNPLLLSELYISDLSAVKGKILRIEEYDYELRNEGVKSYGDSGCPQIKKTYFVFDKNGTVKEVFVAIYPENKAHTSLSVTEYQYGDDFVHRNFKSEFYYATDRASAVFKTMEKSFSVTKDNGKICFYLDGKIAYIFEKSSSGFKSVSYEYGRIESIFEGNRQNQIFYKNEKLFSSEQYEQGQKNFKEILFRGGKNVWLYDGIQGNFSETFLRYENSTEKSKVIYAMERKINSAGFVDFEQRNPIPYGSLGDYRTVRTSVLNAPDKCLLEYFDEYFR